MLLPGTSVPGTTPSLRHHRGLTATFGIGNGILARLVTHLSSIGAGDLTRVTTKSSAGISGAARTSLQPCAVLMIVADRKIDHGVEVSSSSTPHDVLESPVMVIRSLIFCLIIGGDRAWGKAQSASELEKTEARPVVMYFDEAFSPKSSDTTHPKKY